MVVFSGLIWNSKDLYEKDEFVIELDLNLKDEVTIWALRLIWDWREKYIKMEETKDFIKDWIVESKGGSD